MANEDLHTLESEPSAYSAGGNDLALDDDGLGKLRADIARWRATTLADAEKKVPPHKEQRRVISLPTIDGVRIDAWGMMHYEWLRKAESD